MNTAVKTLSTDKVYTFSFWGISQFLDCMAWEVNFWGFRLDFNRLCGSAPVYVGMYELDEDGKDRRHLASRKTYMWNVAMWSEEKPPTDSALASILGEKVVQDVKKNKQEDSDRRQNSQVRYESSRLDGKLCDARKAGWTQSTSCTAGCFPLWDVMYSTFVDL